MAKSLVVVESPAKAKTIEKFLGSDYIVRASYGHVRDLPKKELGVDVKDHFEPTYVIPPKARKVIAGLKDEGAKAATIYLATDFDREGEAIAWHIVEALKKDLKDKVKGVKRITFHEITKEAIRNSLKHCRDIDMDLVDAQQARRVLDRLVGYKLSPFLWKKVFRGLSAGRVQSVAVRLIVEREREIDKFEPREYWTIEALFAKDDKPEEKFEASLQKVDGEPFKEVAKQKEATNLVEDIKKGKYSVLSVVKDDRAKKPAPPFTTSTLQQEANRKLRFSAKQAMMMAQELYEGIEIGKEDSVGLITYMRTDSYNMASSAQKEAQQVITKEFGAKYLPPEIRNYQTKTKGAQEAHEAIRPTSFARTPEKMKSYLNDRQYKLYKLIWERAIASQMADAKVEDTVVEIGSKGCTKDYVFVARGSVVKFSGFIKVYEEGKDEVADDKLVILPALEKDEKVILEKVTPDQHFTQPPARYTEASLVKELEKKGIGRPSTYAPTMSTIVERGYTDKKQGKFYPQDVGMIVTDLLVEHFPDIIDYQFTARMEEELDDIAEGKLEWQPVIKEFYGPFEKNLKNKLETVEKKEITEEKTDEKCPECGKPMVIKLGRYGKFLACTGYPKCKFTRPYLDEVISEKQEEQIEKQESEEKCPKCGAGLMLRDGRFGPFFGCSNYPKCDFTKKLDVTSGIKCPNCDGQLVMKRTRRGKTFWGCNKYPKCKTAFWNEPIDKKCPDCGAIMTINQESKIVKCSECEHEDMADEKTMEAVEPVAEKE